MKRIKEDAVLPINVTDSKTGSLIKMCPLNEMVWKQEYQVETNAFAMTAIILNILSFPVTILMNLLVIMAVKTRPRLQSKYNILLACLAVTDLLVGAASQPTFIAGQSFVLKGLCLTEHCKFLQETNSMFLIPPFASLFHLTLISIERFVALKYTFSYMTIVTGLLLKIAVVSSWVIGCFPGLLRNLSEEYVNKVKFILFPCVVLNLSLILICHLSVYFVTRRHEKQIKCEQVSPQATTRIIIMPLLVCFVPQFVYILFSYTFYSSSNYTVNVIILFHPVFVSILSLNSLCNPIIYCYRNKTFRKTCKELLKMKCTNFNEE